jgi:hypothetical protein
MGEDVSRADGAQTAVTGAPTSVPMAEIEEHFDQLLADLQTATQDEVAAHRLKDFDFTAVIRVKEADHLEAWCLFTGSPEVRDSGSGATADIEVTIPASLLKDFWGRYLALEILEGRATYTGQVRRLLSMMPVIRAAVLRSQNPEAAA